MTGQSFHKYQAVGNAYVVMTGVQHKINGINSPIFGVGGDGVLCEVASTTADFGVKIFNPDGSAAETSGNGLRIFAFYLWQTGRVALNAPFTIASATRRHTAFVLPDNQVSITMGQADILALDEPLRVGTQTLSANVVSMGNPHCVFLLEEPPNEVLTRTLGAQVETHPRFPQRTNVQFAHVLDQGRVQAQVWERGAGYTLSSGSSSCAVAAVVRAKGLCGDDVVVEMDGGVLRVRFSAENIITLQGAVHPVAFGQWMG